MTINQKNWNRLSFFEQMSNIDGEVNRLTECKPEYRDFYLANILKLISATIADPKNDSRRAPELLDEYQEAVDFTKGKYDADYIKSYWNPYTEAAAQKLR